MMTLAWRIVEQSTAPQEVAQKYQRADDESGAKGMKPKRQLIHEFAHDAESRT